jgi:hypothetical protein
MTTAGSLSARLAGMFIVPETVVGASWYFDGGVVNETRAGATSCAHPEIDPDTSTANPAAISIPTDMAVSSSRSRTSGTRQGTHA